MRTNGSPVDILKSNLVGRRLVCLGFHDEDVEYYESIGIDPPAFGHIITAIHLGSVERDAVLRLHMDNGTICEVYDNEDICTDEVSE